jgi:hypothetical protein
MVNITSIDESYGQTNESALRAHHLRAYDGRFWHNLAHLLRIPANFPEHPRNSKILNFKAFRENAQNPKTPKTASQAYDEGSIPFTRSTFRLCQRLGGRRRSRPAPWRCDEL